MWKLLLSIVVALVIFYLIYASLSSNENFASKEEKADYLIERAGDSSSYSDFRSRTTGGFNTDYYKMQNLKQAGQLNRDTLASVL